MYDSSAHLRGSDRARDASLKALEFNVSALDRPTLYLILLVAPPENKQKLKEAWNALSEAEQKAAIDEALDKFEIMF